MGLGIRRLSLVFDVDSPFTHQIADSTTEQFGDDAEASFRGMCARAPADSLRSGISPYGLTMFNAGQLERLVVELEELPENEKTLPVRGVIEAANRAIRHSGHLCFIGD